MLQQTRVETVVPYFLRWMERFPEITSLADANDNEILTYWEGLGYYSRARNLAAAASLILQKYNGKLPQKLEELCKLPGIGRTTAAAIASIAYGQDEPILDANVRRVYARLFNVTTVANSSKGEQKLWKLAVDHLPPGRAGEYNQALMDLGSMICLPRRPRCPECPLKSSCNSRKIGVQEARPVLRKKDHLPHFIQAAAVVVRRIKKIPHVLIFKRPARGLLGGLWEFPNIKINSASTREFEGGFQKAYSLKVKRSKPFNVYQHSYSRFRVTENVFLCSFIRISKDSNKKHFQWAQPARLHRYPMGKIDRQIALELIRELQ